MLTRLACFGATMLLSFSTACGAEDEPSGDTTAAPGPYALVFSGSSKDTTHLYAASGDGWSVRQLPGAFDDLEDPAWSPNFDYVAGMSGTVLRTDGTERHQFDAYLGPGFPWSPDGSELVYSRAASIDTEDPTIYVVAADGSHTRSVSRGTQPTWAPDGRIYFQHPITLATDVVDPDSGRVERFTGNGWFSYGTWSPDGSHVAYTDGETDRGGNWSLGQSSFYDNDLFVVEIGASDQSRVLVEAPVTAHSWSPDGQHLAVLAGRRDPAAPDYTGTASLDVSWELHIVDLDDDSSRKVLEVDARDLWWSPDGEWIALTRYYAYHGFDSRGYGDTDVWLVRADGTELRRVTNGRATGISYRGAAWVPASVVSKAETAR